MKKNFCKELFFIICFLQLSAFYDSCSLLKNPEPDFSVSNLEYKLQDQMYSSSKRGVYFDFLNTAKTAVQTLEIKMTLFDSKTNEPAFNGKGMITVYFSGSVESLEQKTIYIPLDEYIPFEDNRKFKIDLFYISRVLYSDGTEWRDYFGIYEVSN